ncbi:hypothetical protein H710_00569 [Bartonella bacilliformis Ver097]|uniref:Transglycosylase SLT domain-containing protein n=2 Tax=Bartonella bacilliformis TaxID=774 RepID=A0A072R1Z7_BARBA|nr:hypothetical protein H710_00569 [Bartonella bacilliformis Ver097]
MRSLSIKSFTCTVITLVSIAIILPSNAFAQIIFSPQKIPIPLARPHSSVMIQQSKNPLAPPHHIIIPHPNINDIIAIDQLKFGLDSLSKNNITQAITLRNMMAKNSLNRHILTWAIGTSNQTNIPSSELFNALNELKEWPGIALIQGNAERAFVNETNSAQKIIQKFSNRLPITAQGMAAFTEALITTGQITHARQIIAPWWHKTKLNAEEEELILKKAHAALKPIDHLKRMRAMLYVQRISSAERIATLAKAQSLFKAVAAVEKNDPQAAQKLKAVDPSWKKDPLLQFAQIRYLRRTGQYSAAATLMMKAPRDKASLVNPDAWWIERRAISREMLDLNQYQIAYQLVATHIGVTPIWAIDAEFHAGWYALRFLHNPQLAMNHFRRIPQLSSGPVSTSRGYYWMGRTEEVLGEHQNALHYFRRAAHFSTTYYGQLANSRLNQTKLTIPFPKPTPTDRKNFNTRKIVQVIQQLEKVGYDHLAKILYKELGQKIDSPGELALLAVMAEKKGDYHTSLKIGKTAVVQGKNVGALSHPLGAIPASADISATQKALIYAIARQESEFNPTALSIAGAQGILQLLPETAKELAKKHSIVWSPQKLSSNASYNATLSAHFLNEQLERFNGSYILTLISYNAGPRRANEWIERYGDPREQPLDKVIDWIERIPYAETRNYVMRVIENYGVYKARLTGITDIKTDLMFGHPQ